LSNGNHKSEHNGDKAIQGSLESHEKGKIAQLEAPPNESDKVPATEHLARKWPPYAASLQRVENAFSSIRVDLCPLV